MTNLVEAPLNHADPDPHFNRLVALASLSQAALQSVIHALQAQQEIGHEDATLADQNPEELLSRYIRDPDTSRERDAPIN